MEASPVKEPGKDLLHGLQLLLLSEIANMTVSTNPFAVA
jgi:hypothetical protein